MYLNNNAFYQNKVGDYSVDTYEPAVFLQQG